MSHSIPTADPGEAADVNSPAPASPSEFPAMAAPRSRTRRALRVLLPFVALLLFTLGCTAADLAQRSVQVAEPTRTLAPTFTPTSEGVQGVIIVTPPAGSTPGVIIIPPGVDPSTFIVPPPTESPTPTETFTPDPNAPPVAPLPGDGQTIEPLPGSGTPT
ncbi:MAG: hypothetical protein ACRC1H_08850, partial [Caldilineaceae bacterium]